MAKIKKLKLNGTTAYPVTVTDAVFNPNSGKTTTEELSQLALKVNSTVGGEIDISSLPNNERKYIDGTSWKTNSGTYTGNLIDVSGVQKITIEASDDVTAVIAFIQQQEVVNGQKVLFADGYNAKVAINAGQYQNFDVPFNAKYLWVCRLYAETDRQPKSVRIDGIAHKLNDAENKIEGVESKIKNIENTVGSFVVEEEIGVPVYSSTTKKYIRRDTGKGFFYQATAKAQKSQVMAFDVSNCVKIHLLLPPITTGDSYISRYVFSNRSEIEADTGRIIDIADAIYIGNSTTTYYEGDVEIPSEYKYLWVTIDPTVDYSITLFKKKIEGGEYNERLKKIESQIGDISADVEELKKNPVDNMALYYTDELNMIQSFGRIGEDNTKIPSLNFLHISDTHVGGSGGRIGTECIELALAVMNGNSVVASPKPSFMLHTGDMIYTNFKDSFDEVKQLFLESDKNVYFCLGNHDVGDNKIIAQYGTLAQTNERYFVPMLGKWALKTDGGGTPHISGKNYYFQDFTSQKVRLIVLCDFDMDSVISSSDETKYAYAMEHKVFSQQQIDWFVDAIKTMPEGYGFIVAKHMPEDQVPYKSDEAFVDNAFFCPDAHGKYNGMTHSDGWQSIICDIIDAFINKEAKSLNMIQENIAVSGAPNMVLSANVDFTSRPDSSEFICICSGHSHRDTIQFHKRHHKILNLNIAANNCVYYGNDMQQTLGSKSGAVINAYSVNRNTGTITIVRVGANFSAYGQKRDTMTISYRK